MVPEPSSGVHSPSGYCASCQEADPQAMVMHTRAAHALWEDEDGTEHWPCAVMICPCTDFVLYHSPFTRSVSTGVEPETQ